MRLFVALELPAEIKRAIGDATALLKSKCQPARGGVRWSPPEGMHVTLKFIGHAIGDAETERLGAARAALARVRSTRPVEMQFRGVGFFPNARRPQVFWCGVEASGNLAPLAADIERVLEPMGIPREARAFVPHLTLARFRARRDDARKRHARSDVGRTDKSRSTNVVSAGGDELVRAAAEMASIDFGSARETEFHLFESILKPAGAEYRKIETFSFWKESA